MNKINSLSEVIGFNSGFKSAINLYLSLNKPEKIRGYIPTKSSVKLLNDYANAVLNNKEQATVLVGPYGKGKSHLLLVLIAVLSLERTKENTAVINELIDAVRKIEDAGEEYAAHLELLWKKKRFLPVIISYSSGDLHQAFLLGLNDALKRDGLSELAPDTFYSAALDRISDWEKQYPDTYKVFEKEITQRKHSMSGLKAELKRYSKEALELFTSVYPKVTSGSEFNPMAVSEVLPLYKSTSERLVEDYGYSGIYIVFDEFSKFIESQDGLAVGANMKMLQDICELATESHSAQVFFTMVVHKSIKEYGKYLSQDIINAFTGIEGRVIEKYFITSSKNNYELIKNAIVKRDDWMESIPHREQYLGEERFLEFYRLPAFKSSFPEKDFRNIVFNGCFPLNPIASFLLLNVSEKVAQNERTLFTFISNDEPNSMARFVAEHKADMPWSIGADLIYDYFSPLFKKEVTNEFVHNIWLSAEYAIDRCDSDDQRKIIKALAIILIVNKEDELPATEKYLKLSINTDDGNQAIEELVAKEFIYKKNISGAYVFKTRAGSELKAEIRRQREIKGDNVNYSKALLDVTGKYYVIPRKYNTVKMMTRYFANEYMSVEDFLNIDSAESLFENEFLDGKVITLFSPYAIKQEQVKKHLLSLASTKIVVVCPKLALKAQKQLRDYEIISELRDNAVFNNNYEILKKELPLLLDDLTAELESIISGIYEEDPETRVLFFNGEKVKNAKAGNEELAVNECCDITYSEVPVINNEMINRTYIGTAQTKKTRLGIINTILEHQDTPDYYEGTNQEATIYRSLFCVTGITSGHVREDVNSILERINTFVDSCSDRKVPLKDLISELVSSPYGMRLGIIPFYLAYIIANRKEDIIVYFSDKEMQLNAEVLVSMCEFADDYAMYVSKEDLQKEKYIKELNVLFHVEDNRNLTTNRIKDIFICMQRWFRALPQASRNLIEVEKYVGDEKLVGSLKEIKKSLQKVEFNPFEILFVEFPEAFGTDTLEETFRVIDECKTYYDDYFTWIEEQAIDVIYAIWDSKKRQELFHTLREWYEKQSKRSKQGLYDGRTTNFMSCIETLDVYSNPDVAAKIVKAVMDVYMENWNTDALESFSDGLKEVKSQIEAIRDDASTGELLLNFTGRNGELINKLYSHAPESSGSVLRNIIEDALEEYEDLSVNDRVSILLEMIEKIIR